MTMFTGLVFACHQCPVSPGSVPGTSVMILIIDQLYDCPCIDIFHVKMHLSIHGHIGVCLYMNRCLLEAVCPILADEGATTSTAQPTVVLDRECLD